MTDLHPALAAMTLEEKVSLLDGADFWHTQGLDDHGVPSIMVTDGPHGLRKQPQEGDHLGVGGSIPATCFPPAAGLASSWDVDLLRRVGVALGDECRAENVSVLLGPGVNMKRTPLCGRNFEYFSEDPFLAGRLAAAMVQGVQSRGVGTSLKHFAANNQETERMTASAEVDERTLREIYLPAFEHVVRTAQPWTVMCSYNRINGVYASEDPWLLTEVLRDQWGFEGLVVSDWGAVNERPAAVAAGLDLEMPSSSGAGTRAVLEAVAAGTLTEAEVDLAASRVLALVDKARPVLEATESLDVEAHHALAREAAAASAVLLENEGDLLPLDPSSGGRVAVIGEMARTPRYQGAGSSQVVPTQLDDALTALQEQLAGRREVSFAQGYVTEAEEADPRLVDEAVQSARGASVVLLFLGLPAAAESEGYDRTHLDLPAQQVALLEAVAEVSRDVVVVLANGSAVSMPWRGRVRAVLEGWLLGQAGGSALADLLLGRVSPSGRLAETIPLRLADTPAVGAFPGEEGVVRYGEGLLIGYRWYDARQMEVAYPFGHGLTYTRFEHTDLEVTAVDAGAAQVQVSLTVTNTGPRAGVETVQVYVSDPASSVYRPEQELKGFARVPLAPGESQRVTVPLDARAFAWWSTREQRWVVEGGAFEVRVGASSRDVRATASIELPGDRTAPALDLLSPVGTWLDHPEVGPRLREHLGTGPFEAMLDDPTHGEMMRAIPVIRMSRFPGFPLDEAELEGWAAQVRG
ncbi:glycoside hydrolase family 3 C-terminal domain-containing protein [Actinotalea sp. BY-33]|uniref:Exo-alpha-(1->6)-L-arabinopyranosidase n=1 Tax=Actinotalea soli TaxID=2819234 RepID=A0A939RWY1_9CELL|nr:glycoside hydrolase family 3 C-terminal domain-containing protein [Actinotalea soli]MBO1753098.1 glycoside hydrolase family 3 C-terminal domain-containing protein [Actinotalea soli]